MSEVLADEKAGEILSIAMEVFLENGYENTSIRMIEEKCVCKEGLICKYFDNKDELLEKAMQQFFLQYKDSLEGILEKGRRNPFRLISMFFEFLENEVIRFQGRYGKNLHWTIRLALQERAIQLLKPYLKKIVEILLEKGANLTLSVDAAVLYLSRGVCSILMQENLHDNPEMKIEIRKGVNLIMGLSPDTAGLICPQYATREDMLPIIELAQKEYEYYSKFEPSEFKDILEKAIDNKEVYVIRIAGEVKGVAIFSKEQKEVMYITVDEAFRGRGVSSRFMTSIQADFPEGTKLSLNPRY